ncbi:hypothetical protein SUGI_0381870 [Cryptomeria japonica]|uniref:small ribosomal subunit protein bS21c n=1 Tax=Cryptomeria japonica TaxID=3369 RepID=UPI002408B9D4|nr:small ribosomal subunit protein bS21c [Cryptomeria japonica]XP_057828458.1 small ribosomal subunit protein bS21c [Cryptomeria japonica]XP_057828459.1 small ribosomal subunit protein bS21c [Cryptomeria japonica]GLJ20920.1 hypothetical protein SUGI_0381870 [Cryptomeria japonica]
MASAAMGLASGLCYAVPNNANQINLSSVKLSQLTIKEGPVKNKVSIIARAYNAQVFVGDGEPEDEMVKRFRRAVWEAGVISECRRRRYFESPQDALKRKNQVLRNKKKRRYSKAKSYRDEKNTDDNENVEEAEGNDHWDGPMEGGMPF